MRLHVDVVVALHRHNAVFVVVAVDEGYEWH